MIHWMLLGLSIASTLWTTRTRAEYSFECIAEKQGVRYTVKLGGPRDQRTMIVLDSRGSSTSGRATVYRRGTRYFLPGEAGRGFKLGIDGDTASLCFEDGGHDCHACQPITSIRERYVSKTSCITSTPRGRLSVTLYSASEPAAEMVIEDEAGEVASGRASMPVSIENFAILQIGPGESYVYRMDSGSLCTNQNECYPCESTIHEIAELATPLPETLLARCAYAGIHASLTERGGEYFLRAWYNQREEGTGEGFGYQDAPATNLGADRWRGGSHELTLFGTVAELCTPWDGCGACAYELE